MPSSECRPMMRGMGTNGGLFSGSWTDLTGWLRGKPKEEDRRIESRLPIHDQAHLSWRLDSGLQQSTAVNVIDVSDLGFKVRCGEDIAVGTSIRLTDSNGKSVAGSIVYSEQDEDAYLLGAYAEWTSDEDTGSDASPPPAA